MVLLQHIYYYPSIVNSTILWCTFPMVIKNREQRTTNFWTTNCFHQFHLLAAAATATDTTAAYPLLTIYSEMKRECTQPTGSFRRIILASSSFFFCLFNINNTVNMINAGLLAYEVCFCPWMLFINFSLVFILFFLCSVASVINLNHMSKITTLND